MCFLSDQCKGYAKPTVKIYIVHVKVIKLQYLGTHGQERLRKGCAICMSQRLRYSSSGCAAYCRNQLRAQPRDNQRQPKSPHWITKGKWQETRRKWILQMDFADYIEARVGASREFTGRVVPLALRLLIGETVSKVYKPGQCGTCEVQLYSCAYVCVCPKFKSMVYYDVILYHSGIGLTYIVLCILLVGRYSLGRKMMCSDCRVMCYHILRLTDNLTCRSGAKSACLVPTTDTIRTWASLILLWSISSKHKHMHNPTHRLLHNPNDIQQAAQARTSFILVLG